MKNSGALVPKRFPQATCALSATIPRYLFLRSRYHVAIPFIKNALRNGSRYSQCVPIANNKYKIMNKIL